MAVLRPTRSSHRTPKCLLLPILLIIALSLPHSAVSTCGTGNKCSMHGACTPQGYCVCTSGYSGVDCSLRDCPYGPAWGDIASEDGIAHAAAECSGRGHCDYEQGICECDPNFDGPACNRLKCPNSCNDHGICMSMRDAADRFDGFRLNRTSTYDLWDADMIHGCVCDPGFTGYDCSLRECPYSPDYRDSDLPPQEIIRLYCKWDETGGSITLRANRFSAAFFATDNAATVQSKLTTARNPAPAVTVTMVTNPTPPLGGEATLCSAGGTITTFSYAEEGAEHDNRLYVEENLLDVEARRRRLAVDADLPEVYFMQDVAIKCSCGASCSGSFNLELDDVLSSAIPYESKPSDVADAARALRLKLDKDVWDANGSGVDATFIDPSAVAEIQTVTFAGDDNTPNSQRVSITRQVTNEVQSLIFEVNDIDTFSCPALDPAVDDNPCPAVESKLSGTFAVSFDFDQCGGSSVNYCQRNVDELSSSAGPVWSTYAKVADFTGSVTGNTLSVTSVYTGSLAVGMTLSGTTGVPGSPTIVSIGNVEFLGTVNNYVLDVSALLNSETLAAGMAVSGPGIQAGTTIEALGTCTFSGTISGTTLLVTEVKSGRIAVGQPLSGVGVTAETLVSALGTAVFTASISGTTLTVASMQSGTIAVGMQISGAGVDKVISVAMYGSGSGGAGSYTISDANSVTSTTLTATSTGATGMYTINKSHTISSATKMKLGTGFGSTGTYTLSTSHNLADTMTLHAVSGGGTGTYILSGSNLIRFTGEISRTTLTVTAAPTPTLLTAGLTLAGVGVTAGTTIVALNAASFSGTISGTTLTVKSLSTGTITLGLTLYGDGVEESTTIVDYGTSQFDASIIGTTMTVTSLTSGTIETGLILSGTGVKSGTTITAFGTAKFTATATGRTLTVTAITSGSIAVGQTLSGPGITVVGGPPTITASLGTGSFTGNGGVGTYQMSSVQSINAPGAALTTTSTGDKGTYTVSNSHDNSDNTQIPTPIPLTGTTNGGQGAYTINLSQTTPLTTMTLGSASGSLGQYTISQAQTVLSAPMTATYTVSSPLRAVDKVLETKNDVRTFSGAIAGTTLTVTSTPSGMIALGSTLTGTDITSGTTITAYGTASFTGTISGTTLIVSAMSFGSGPIAVGMTIAGSGIIGSPTIIRLIPGTETYEISASYTVGAITAITAMSTGGKGTYTVSVTQTVPPTDSMISTPSRIVTCSPSASAPLGTNCVTQNVDIKEVDQDPTTCNACLAKRLVNLIDDRGFTGFMTDMGDFGATEFNDPATNVKSVAVVRTAKTTATGKCEVAAGDSSGNNICHGAYTVKYTVTFLSDTLRGDVPSITGHSSNVAFDVTTYATPCVAADTTTSCGGISAFSADDLASVIVSGTQPAETFTLRYECESDTYDISGGVDVTEGSAYITMSGEDNSVVAGKWLRFNRLPPGVTPPASSAIFVGTISGTTLIVSDFTRGTISVGHELSGTGIAPGTTITGFGTAAFTGTISSTRLTVTALLSGSVAVGQTLSGYGIIGSPVITSLGASSITASISGTTMTVTAIVGVIGVGMTVTGGGVTLGIIEARLTGTGGTGDYTISSSHELASSVMSAVSTGGTGIYTISVAQSIATATSLTSTSKGGKGAYYVSTSHTITSATTITAFGKGFEYDLYRKIVAVSFSAPTTTITVDKVVTKPSGRYLSASVGYFYSDYGNIESDSGVSDTCRYMRYQTTYPLAVESTPNMVKDALRALESIGNRASVTVTSNFFTLASDRLKMGLYWDITFNSQPGRVNELICVTSGGSTCATSTVTSATMFSGSQVFDLELGDNTQIYSVDGIAWNADPSRMVTVFGAVGLPVMVTRSGYKPSSASRWSGGYSWTITFAAGVDYQQITVPSFMAGATVAAATIQSGSSTDLDSNQSVCSAGEVRTMKLTFKSSIANIPTLGAVSSILWSGVYRSDAITTADLNRLSPLRPKECGGIGNCNRASGLCDCGFGFRTDKYGGCEADIKTSAWTGLETCPGVILQGTSPAEVVLQPASPPRTYFSQYSNKTNTGLHFIEPAGAITTVQLLKNLTDYGASGLALDLSGGYIYFADETVHRIDRIKLFNTSNIEHRNKYAWSTPLPFTLDPFTHIQPTTPFGIALDLRFHSQYLYWTVPSATLHGEIYRCAIPKEKESYFSSHCEEEDLTAVIKNTLGPTAVRNPQGVALDLERGVMYWAEKGVDNTLDGKIYSSKLDGTGARVLWSSNLYDPVGLALDLKRQYLYITEVSHGGVSGVGSIGRLTLNRALGTGTVFNTIITKYKVKSKVYADLKSPMYIALDYDAERIVYTDTGHKLILYANWNSAFMLSDSGLYITEPVKDPRGFALDAGGGYPDGQVPYYDCFGNGSCLNFEGDFKCSCNDGFLGNCNITQCPVGYAWFDEARADNDAHRLAECSNMGVCDTLTGTCLCREGFSGAACDRMDCPKNRETGLECSGRGRCLTMQTLALQHKVLGNPTPRKYDYLSTSLSHPQFRWEAEKIQGCKCDEFYYILGDWTSKRSDFFGYDCSLTYCPYGEDPVAAATATQHFETQKLTCTATGGTFVLSFKGDRYENIPHSVTRATLEKILENMKYVGAVDVTYSDASSATAPLCTTGGTNFATVTFKSELGNVPMIVVDASGLTPQTGGAAAASVVVVESVMGTKTNWQCSRQGLCNTETGECECFPGFASSDGDGNMGLRNDCGYFGEHVGYESRD